MFRNFICSISWLSWSKSVSENMEGLILRMNKQVFAIKSQRVKEMTHWVREDLSLKPPDPT